MTKSVKMCNIRGLRAFLGQNPDNLTLPLQTDADPVTERTAKRCKSAMNELRPQNAAKEVWEVIKRNR